MRKKQSIIAATLGTVALIATFTLAGAGTATASTTDPTTGAGALPSCWADATTGESLCVPAGQDLIAAVQAEAGVSITVPSTLSIGGVTGSALSADASLSVTPAVSDGDVVSGIYDDINYGGSVFLLTASGSGCDWGVSSLVPYGWNDRASSFKSFNGCKTAVFQNIDYGGTKLGYSTDKSSFGSMNDAASSWATD
jgi:hypothetical protein